MIQATTAVLGVGNILENDDGIAVYAAAYLDANYRFEPPVRIINGGVEGINLLDVFIEHERVLILDAIDIEDDAGSIYHIPASELTGYGLGNGGAHEVGVIQCLDMLELMGRPQPESSVLGIVPERVEVRIGLSPSLTAAFEGYVGNALKILQNAGIAAHRRDPGSSLAEVIEAFQASDVS
ncbi:hydrogenase maturation protease [Thiomicrolovo sp. ZZH C-3]